ncbi:MAG: hypothetical protein ACYST6_02040 [Planctomycetota bacterium]
MRASSFSRISLLFGVILGLMVAWAAAAPSTMMADLLTGGWVPTPEGDCCEGDHMEDCDEYEGCNADGNEIVTCENLDPDPVIGVCTPGADQPCTDGTEACVTTWDGECE